MTKEEKSIYDKKRRELNKDKFKEKDRKYWELNKEKKKEYRRKNKEKIALREKEYKKLNRHRSNERQKYRILTDPKFKLKCILRMRFYNAIKRNSKSGSAVKDLGCSIEFLKSYLESKFTTGMSWNNHGQWHIDHIIPLDSFNLSIREELLKACHYTNLQPLWAYDNIRKSNKLLNPPPSSNCPF